MITRISTGTGLVLLAGAVVFHAVVTTGAGTTEAIAAPVWTPVLTPAAIEPQNTPPGSAPAPVSAPQPIGFAVVTTASNGNGTVLFRLWPNGTIERRLVNSAAGLSYQNGWQPLVTTP
ncbi:MAG: hypothetical protein EBR07_02625 [Planctomycetes bacterium]|nr:hypothetical protein [Planctomycetota bacterium]